LALSTDVISTMDARAMKHGRRVAYGCCQIQTVSFYELQPIVVFFLLLTRSIYTYFTDFTEASNVQDTAGTGSNAI